MMIAWLRVVSVRKAERSKKHFWVLVALEFELGHLHWHTSIILATPQA
jgi:hypothetical protein